MYSQGYANECAGETGGEGEESKALAFILETILVVTSRPPTMTIVLLGRGWTWVPR